MYSKIILAYAIITLNMIRNKGHPFSPQFCKFYSKLFWTCFKYHISNDWITLASTIKSSMSYEICDKSKV